MKNQNNRNLLIIDDEKDLLDSLKLYLEGHGFSVTACLNVEQALIALRQSHFDLVLTDIEMPLKSGIDLIEMQTEGMGITTPIIIMSGRANVNYLAEAIRLGVSDFITKPIQPHSLLGIIKQQINKFKRKTLDFDLDHSTLEFHKSYIFYPEDFFSNSIVGFLFAEIHKNLKIHASKKNEIYLILEEAMSNAFMHGLWLLSPEERHSERETLEKTVNEKFKYDQTKLSHDQSVSVDISYSKRQGKISIIIEDTGAGYDHVKFFETINNAVDPRLLSGRGLFLIHSLSESLKVYGNGSKVEIIISAI